MSTYLLGKHNLADIDNIEKARTHLGLGDLCTFNVDDINITGGTIKVDQFWLLSNYGDSKILKSDENGMAYWGHVENCNYESNISQFHNDVGYLTNGDILNSLCNLSDLPDRNIAVTNLGLQEAANKSFDTLRISHLYLPTLGGDTTLKALTISENNGKVKLTDIHTDPDTYATMTVTSANDNTLVSLAIVQALRTTLKSEIDITNCNIIRIEDELSQIGQSGQTGASGSLLRKDRYLSEISDCNEKALSNLGLDFIDTVDHKITIHDLYFNSNERNNKGGFLQIGDTISDDGLYKTTWESLPVASLCNIGVVQINDESAPEVHHHIFSKTKINNLVDAVSDRVGEIQLSVNTIIENVNDTILGLYIPTHLSSFTNDTGYMSKDKCLSELRTNLSDVYSNLNLVEIAWTGSYNNLVDIPSFISENNLNGHFLQKDNFLSDFEGNYDTIRENLGLGDMALQSSSNISITDGVINNLTSLRTTEFILDSNVPNFESLCNLLFMKAIDANGTAGWDTLPVSSQTQAGLVHVVENKETCTNNDYPCVYTTSFIDDQFENIISSLSNLQTSLNDMDTQILDDLTLTNLHILESGAVYWENEAQFETTDDGVQYNRVLTMGAYNKSEWTSMSNIMSSKSFTDINRINLHEVTAINTKSLDVYESIQFDDGIRFPPKKIPIGCIIYSDANGGMHWNNALRFIDDPDDADPKIGFQFENENNAAAATTPPSMLFYNDNGHMIIAESNISGITPKHIFR